MTKLLSYQKKPPHKISVVAQDRCAKSRFATRAPDTATVHLSLLRVRIFVPVVWKDYAMCKKTPSKKKGVPQGSYGMR